MSRRTPQPRLFSNPLLFLGLLTVPFDRAAKEGFLYTQQFFVKGSGYLQEQATKPQTLGYGLADSPVGLLAWIYEKLVGWTDEYPWTDDEGESRDVPLVVERGRGMLTPPNCVSVEVDLRVLVLPRRPCRIPPYLLRSHRRGYEDRYG